MSIKSKEILMRKNMSNVSKVNKKNTLLKENNNKFSKKNASYTT